jgi:hypothetical protein
MEGEGFSSLIVSPSTYSQVTRSFGRGAGAEISLTPQEIVANKEAAPEMEGEGIFGTTVDRWLKRKGLKKAAYKIGDQLKPAAKTALVGGLSAAGAALAAANPALLPYVPVGVAALSNLGLDYIDNPDAYWSSNAGGTKARKARSLVGRMAQDKALAEINAATGSNLGSLDRAAIESALANKFQAEVEKKTVRYDVFGNPVDAFGNPTVGGSGLYLSTGKGMRPSGSGLYAGSGLGLGVGGMSGRRSGGLVGLNGGMVGSGLPPALMSDPYGANFQFRHTLPPKFQM